MLAKRASSAAVSFLAAVWRRLLRLGDLRAVALTVAAERFRLVPVPVDIEDSPYCDPKRTRQMRKSAAQWPPMQCYRSLCVLGI